MEIQDGFIVAIFNYCDRWCETCAFTSHCRLFADGARADAEGDPNMRAILEAPPLPADVRPTPAWMRELIDELNEAAEEALLEHARDWPRPDSPPEHEGLQHRARAYTLRVHEWLSAHDGLSVRRPDDPRAVIGWFHTLIGAKTHRALSGLGDPIVEGPSDADGSAKVALLGIDRSRIAWQEMLQAGHAPVHDVEAFLADLDVLAEELERIFPRARAFVRPAFDEPEEVARLRWE